MIEQQRISALKQSQLNKGGNFVLYWMKSAQRTEYNHALEGAFNLASPNSVTKDEFSHEIGDTLHRPSWLHIPPSLAKHLMGEMAEEIILPSQKVYPKRLIEAGFQFSQPDLSGVIAGLREK